MQGHAPEPAPDSPPGELVPASDRDRPLNIGFEVYRPIRPLAGKSRGENLFWHSLMVAGCIERWDDPLHVLQRARGRDRTIWGIHYDLEREALSWEIRVLSPALAELRTSLADAAALAPGLEAEPEACAVVGVHFDANTEATIPALEFHVRSSEDPRKFEVIRASGETREVVSRDLLREPKREIDDVLPAVKTSEAVDFSAHPRLLGRVMIPEIYACRRLHISKRPGRDALCFSGLNVDQLLFTYKRFELPEPMLEFLTIHRDALEHLLFDVCVEYREQDGRIHYPSVAIYGCF